MCACRIWMKECMDLCSVFSPRSSEVHAPTITAQSQYNMQVFLQLPNGQTIPVQIPANSAGGLQVVPPSVMTSRVEQQPVVNTPIQHQTVILPAQTTSPAQSQSNITKQVNPIATTVLLKVLINIWKHGKLVHALETSLENMAVHFLILQAVWHFYLFSRTLLS